jgi:hypothetical protein
MKWFSGLEGRHTLCRGRKAPVLWPPLFALGPAGRHTIKKYPGTVPACCVITELLRVDRSVRPKGAKGDSPGQSEAPPWVRLRDGNIGSPALDEPFGPNSGGFRGR